MIEPKELDMTGAEFCQMAQLDRIKAYKANKTRKRMLSILKVSKEMLLIAFIFSLIFFAGYITSPVSMKNTRIETGEVIKAQNGTITVITDDGNVWTIKNDQYKGYNKIYAIFNTQGTETILDDSIDFLQRR